VFWSFQYDALNFFDKKISVLFACFFQSDSSDTSGELNPVQVAAGGQAVTLPRYGV